MQTEIRKPGTKTYACTIPCNFCGGKNVQTLATRDRDGRPLRTVMCRRCGLVWTDPRPEAAKIDEYYRKDYRLDYKKAFEPRRAHVWRAGQVALSRWAQLCDQLSPGARVLDVGSGGGEWLHLLQKKGCGAIGIEPNEGYARFAQREYGVDVLVCTWRDAQIPAGSCDAATLHHALEHMDDPQALLTQVGQWLRPGGVLAIEVPNVEATTSAPNHRFHRAHLYSFNPPALEAMGRKAGFAVIRTQVSDDDGVIATLLRKGPQGSAPEANGLDGNAERITNVLRRHTLLRHYLSRHPYRRPFLRVARTMGESWAVRGRRSGKEILDACFASGNA